MRRIFGITKLYRFRLISSQVLLLISVIATVGFATLTQGMVNKGMVEGDVDTRTEKLIQDGLRNLMAGKTSFSIAHRLATIRGSARIMVVNGGEIVEMASHDELIAQKGFYYSLYMSQFKGAAPGGMEAATADFAST